MRESLIIVVLFVVNDEIEVMDEIDEVVEVPHQDESDESDEIERGDEM